MKLMTPLDYYTAECAKGAISADPEQLQALAVLQRTFFALIDEQKKRDGWGRFLQRHHGVRGIYLWGSVGIGKTFLMDCFYNCLPFAQKIRMHFHPFMRKVHQELSLHQGEADPLQVIAKELSRNAIVLCFDEFYVADITDAMLLGRLLTALIQHKVCCIATSNVAPDNLYKNGLQRLQFLPAIELIKQYLDVVHVPSKVDYRLRHLQQAGVFYTPLDQKAEDNMQATFALLAQGKPVDAAPLDINGRTVRVKKKTDAIIWFDFVDICTVPRSQNDFLTIAERYHTVFISNVPHVPAEATDTVCLFISLVDVFYDAHVKIVMSAAAPVQELYNKGHKVLDYARTHSRLVEMQSLDYFLND